MPNLWRLYCWQYRIWKTFVRKSFLAQIKLEMGSSAKNNILTRWRHWQTWELLSVLAVIFGIIFRLRQYFVNRSFWVDEASLALNIINRSFGGLLQPLDYNQGAPIGFLFVEKLMTLLTGNNEFSLRFLPLLSGLLSVFLIYLIAKQQLGGPGLFAILMIAISPLLIYYSSELKQYSSDVMFTLLLVYLATFCFAEKPNARNFILLALAGAIAIWMSHPSIFVLAGIGLVLAVEILLKKDYRQLAWILAMGLTWLSMLGLNYLVSLNSLAKNDYLKEYWLNHFFPFPPWIRLDWYRGAFASLLENISPNFGEPYFLILCIILVLIGTVSFFWRNARFALLMTLPFIVASVVSALQKYPLSGRFMLFLVPLIALLSAEGLSRIYFLAARWNQKAAIIIYGLALLGMLWVPAYQSFQVAIMPEMGEHIKPVLAHIEMNKQENDVIYIYSGSVNPFRYYASAYHLDNGNISAIEGSAGVKGFMKDVENLHGKKRVWFIFTHVIGCGDCEGDKLQFYVDILNQYGIPMDEFDAPGAAAFLYELHP